MNFIEANLAPDETLVFQTGIHWAIILGPVFWLAVAGVLFSLTLGSLVSMVPVVIGLWALIVSTRRLNTFFSTEYGLTSKRVIVKYGLLRRRTRETTLAKVEGTNVDQSMMGRSLGYGNVIVVGTGGTGNSFPMIKDPFGFRQKVQEQIATLVVS